VPRPLSAPPLTLNPSDGPKVIAWIERHCRHGEGEKFGEAVRLELWQKLWLTMLFELRPDGTRRYRRALLETPKGAGKTPLASWVAAYMLCNQKSPVIPVAAASFEQAGLLFDDLRACVTESPTLSRVLLAFENECQVADGPGRAYRVAAIAGTNDGQRPTTFLADEIHEWLGPKARVHLILSNGCSKRRDSLELNLTTPGVDKETTLAGRLHEHGLKVNNGETVDDSFLFCWFGAEPDKFDLTTPDGLRAAIRAANPSADLFVDVEDVAAKHSQVPASEFARYYLAQWVTGEQTWLPDGAFEACADPGVVIPDGTSVVLGFDGSFAEDSTALVVATCAPKPHLDVIGLWEKPEAAEGWTVPILDVENAIRTACQRWSVKEIVVDPYGYRRTYQILVDEGLPVVDYPQNSARMCPATQRMFELLMNRGLTHSGDPRLTRHFSNAALKPEGSRGARVVKESKTSTRKVDLVIASIMAIDRAAAPMEEDYDIMKSVY
jgi:phage terminase large subunit-like protein